MVPKHTKGGTCRERVDPIPIFGGASCISASAWRDSRRANSQQARTPDLHWHGHGCTIHPRLTPYESSTLFPFIDNPEILRRWPLADHLTYSIIPAPARRTACSRMHASHPHAPCPRPDQKRPGGRPLLWACLGGCIRTAWSAGHGMVG
jgi:hypothetical protein